MADGAENKNNKFKLSLAGNPWKLSTIVLAVLCIILLVFALRGRVTGNVISEDPAPGFGYTGADSHSGGNAGSCG